jgi:hypothetical protein
MINSHHCECQRNVKQRGVLQSPGYHGRVRRVFLLLVVAGIAAGPALGARDPALEKSLKADMVKTFKKQAPTLKFTTVNCTLPVNGTTAHCKAYFTVKSTKGYYPVKATIHDNGKLSWTAQSPKCLNPATKKYIAC